MVEVNPKFNDPDDVDPAPKPVLEPSDPHTTPLDDVEDVKWLAEDDPRRKAIEQHKLEDA